MPEHCLFPSIAYFDPSGRDTHAVAADLDGTLLVSRSSFPYFFLLAAEAGSLFRAACLLLFSPLIFLVYKFASESAGIQIMIFVAMSGIPIKDIEFVARSVLPRFYAADVRRDSYRAFRACARRRVVVTANPTVMVEPFVRECLGGDQVLGTELEVDLRTGKATGFVVGAGVLVGEKKRDAVRSEFGDELPELGIGDRKSDHPFMAICKDGYMVPPNRSAPRAQHSELQTRPIFHDGRLVLRPDPLPALLLLLWLPLALPLALLRISFTILLPSHLLRHAYRLSGVRLSIHGLPPPPSPSSLLVSNHRTSLDPIFITIALARCIYTIPRHFHFLPPILPANAPLISDLRSGDVLIRPEGTSSRESFLLRFTAPFAELSDRIVPVAINTRQSVFFGATARGLKFADPIFFFMNPRPEYEVIFLPPLRRGDTCAGGRLGVDVANHVQKAIADELGFECTEFTIKDKYLRLGIKEGRLP